MAADRRRPRGAQRGAALIEVMVALLIFLVGVLGIVGLQAKAVQFSVQAEDRSRAALLANEFVTAMWQRRTFDLPKDDVEKWQAHVAAALPAGSASAVRGNDGLVRVTIQWVPPGAASIGSAKPASRYETKIVLP